MAGTAEKRAVFAANGEPGYGDSRPEAFTSKRDKSMRYDNRLDRCRWSRSRLALLPSLRPIGKPGLAHLLADVDLLCRTEVELAADPDSED